MNFKEYKKNQNVRMRKFEDKYYLIYENKVHLINYLGVAIYKYIGEEISLEKFCMKIIDKYSKINIEDVKKDILEFILELEKKGIIFYVK